jgi:hypothetical protein
VIVCCSLAAPRRDAQKGPWESATRKLWQHKPQHILVSSRHLVLHRKYPAAARIIMTPMIPHG